MGGAGTAWWIPVLAAGLLTGVWVWVFSSAQRRVAAESQMNPEEFTIRMPRAYFWLLTIVGALAIAFAVLIAVILAVGGPNPTAAYGIMLAAGFFVVGAGCEAGALWCLVWGLHVARDTVLVRGLFRGTRELRFADINRVKVRLMPGPRMTLYTGGKALISVESTQQGYNLLARKVRAAGIPWEGPGNNLF